MKEAGLKVTISKEDLDKAVDSINKKLLTIDKTMKGVTSNLKDLTTKAGLDISKMGEDAAKGFKKGTDALQKLNSEFGQKANLQSYLDLLKQVEGELNKISATTNGTSSLKAKTPKQSALLEEDIKKIQSGANVQGLNIPQLQNAIATLNAQIGDTNSKLTVSQQQKLVDVRKYYEEELRLAQKSTEEKKKELDKQTENLKKSNETKRKSNKKLADQTPLYDYKNTDISGIDAVNRSYNERVRLSKELTEYSRNLVKGTDEYAQKQAVVNKKIQELAVLNKNASTEGIKLEKTKRKIMDTAGQLTRRIALLFSVSQITRFVHEMIMVRGEFELQQRALQAILQDKDAADKLFGQITQLAIKSPFKTSELVSYTKQLAAYRIEEDKLYETTYRLADISSGLGVDMQRLILAFGQVKAANYLRGQELRQFSEAGINILGELAEQFSTVEGRAVSTGEVFERVSKRMVTFGDVEDVFKRLTDEGGIFYNMQEIQSETLKGKWLNLRDALDLMYNDMGKGNEGVLKNSVDIVRSMILNWENLAYWIKWVAGLLGTYKLASMAAAFATKNLGNAIIKGTEFTGEQVSAMRLSTREIILADGSTKTLTSTNAAYAKSARVVQGAVSGLGAAIKVMLPAAVILGVIALVTKLTEASREAKRLKKELDKISRDGFDSFNQATASLKRLGEELENVTAGTKKHKDLVSQISTQYGEYIPFLFSEKSALDSITKSYDDILVSMKNVAHQRAYDKGLAEIEAEYGEDVTSLHGEVQDILIEKWTNFGLTIKDASKIIEEWKTALSELDLTANKPVGRGMDAWVREQRVDKLTEITKKYLEFAGSVPDFREANTYIISNLGGAFDIINNKTKVLQQTLDGTFGSGLNTKALNEELEAINVKYDKLIENSTTSIGDENLLIEKQVEILELKNKAGVLSNADLEKEKDELVNWAKEDVVAVNKEMEKYGESLYAIFRITPEQAKNSKKELIDATKDQWESAKETVDILNRQKKAGTPLSVIDQEDLLKQTKIAEAAHKKLVMLGYDFGTVSGGVGSTTNKLLEKTKEQIAAINEVITKYDEYLKVFSIDASRQLIRNDFSGLFRQLGLGLVDSADFSEQWATELLKGLANKLSDVESKKALEKALRDIDVKVKLSIGENEIKTAQNKIDKLVEDLKLTNELRDLSLPLSWVSMIFGDEVTTLADIKTKGEQIIYDLMSAGGQDRVAKAQEIGLKLKEIEADTWKENIKTIAEAAKKYQSVDNAVKNVRERTQELIEWVKENVPEAEQAGIIANILSMSDSQIAELQAEAFKATDIYAQMFGDIKDYGDYTLNYLINKAKEMTGEFSDITGVGAKFIKEDGKTKVSMSWKDESGNVQQVTVSLAEYRSVLKQVLKLEEEVIGEGIFAKSIDGWKRVALASDDILKNNEKLKVQQKELLEAERKLSNLRQIGAKENGDLSFTKEYDAYIAKQKEVNETEENNKKFSSNKWEAISEAVHATAGEINNVISSYSFLGDLLGETGKEFVSTFTELGTVVVDIVGTVKDLAQQMGGAANEVVDTVSNLAKTSSLIMLIVKAVLIIIEYVYKAFNNAGKKIRDEIDLIDKDIDYLEGMQDRIDFDLLNNITEKEILKRELNERLQIINEFQAKYAQTAEQLGEKASRTWGEGWLSSMSFGTTALVSAVENAFKGDWGEAGKALANSLTLGVVGLVEGLIKLSRKKDLGNWLDTLAVKEEYIIKLNEILNSNLTDLQKSAEVTAANLDYQIGKLTEKYERYQELAEKGKAKEEDLDAMDEAEQELFDRQRERAMVYANTISEQYGDIFNNLADSITSALEGAWENLTDPAKAFEEAWTESIKSVIFNMLKINYIMPQLQEWMKSFYLSMGLNADGTQITGVTPDMTLTEREAADLRQKYNTVVGITEDAWNTLVGTLDALGVKTGDTSALSNGIQGVTEREAEALEALLNSMRYRIFSHYNYVEPRMDTIIDKLTVSNTIGQQILLNTGEMRTTLNSMLTAFNSVLTQGVTNGIGIRVYANM